MIAQELRLQVADVPTPGNAGRCPAYARGLLPYSCIALASRPSRAYHPRQPHARTEGKVR
eukprot:scaffold25462_cov36-Phaeocystis_antarctica.AAC.2